MIAAATGWAVLWLLVSPGELLAWGPATHIAIGEGVLASAHLLPPALRALLTKHRIPFLYGSVAADISFAKKYAPAGRHCHHWHVGEEILASADSEELRAVGFGYLAHLAADTIAHNVFVPRRLLLTLGSEGVGHTYWEHRMDVQLGAPYTSLAREVVLHHDHADADRLFDDVLSRTLFSFRTNRRIFRGMVAFQDDARWHRVFAGILRRSRHDLPVALRDTYVRLSYEYVMDYLVRGEAALPRSLDPIGEEKLRLAKTLRREVRRDARVRPGSMEMALGAPLTGRGSVDLERVAEEADTWFPLPGEPRLYLPRARPLEIPGLGQTPPDGGVPPTL
jgi:hypothetical protein